MSKDYPFSMKLRSDFVWAAILIGTAVISFYLGTRIGSLDTKNRIANELQEQAEKIKVLENKNQQLSEELKSRGVFSYPQANLVAGKTDAGPKVLILLNGKDAIENLEIKRKVGSFSSNPTRGLAKIEKSTHIGTLTAHNPIAFEIENFEKYIFLEFSFRAGGKEWHQYLVGRKTSKGKIKTFWVITDKNSEVIDKHVDQGFPTDNNGNLLLGGDEKLQYSDIRMNSKFVPGEIF